MAEIDSTRILTPLSPTYMPYFLPHHSPLHSSSNTRQRDDYEFSSECCPSSPSPQVLVTLTDDEDCDGPPPTKADRLIDGYPAWELPFASEPALEGELEQGLPPLKKLKPEPDNLEVGTRLDKHTPEGLVLHTAVKGILTKRDSSSSMPHSPSASSPICAETCFLPWSRSLGLGLTTSNMSTPFHSSTPLSRRSSSGASSACASSLKAVRFASGNGFPVNLITHGLEPSLPILPREIEGPVAAVMYLTHSAEAYDRSPIVVENGLRLPPRAKPEDEDDEEEQETLLNLPEKKRRGKISVVITKMNQDKLCTSPEAISPQADNDQETSVVIKPLSLSMCRTYREIEEVDEEEDDETNNGPDLAEEGEDEETKPEDDKQQDDDDNSDDDDDRDHEPHHLPQRTFSSSSSTSTKRTPSSCATAASSQAQWGLGKWSSGEVVLFFCVDDDELKKEKTIIKYPEYLREDKNDYE
ncbi:hypothetical protein PSHT_02865 [Puccinia striiformis]|uniref:Uncharacterized protein n=1 Tax=Puccinia striiformis TaxID=27350 RepID=A0A2S4WGY7_9BASI|nr:hypothetical protein PSHT_02865 [Puccinia striiformis]